MVRPRYILKFADISEKIPVGLIGESAFNLAMLANAGFPVPSGFVVTSSAYEEFLNRGGLLKAKAEWSERLRHCDEAQKRELIEGIKSQVLEIFLPAVIEADLRDAYESISGDGQGVILRWELGEGEDDEICKAISAEDAGSFVGAVRECWAEILLVQLVNEVLPSATGDKRVNPSLLCLKNLPAVSHGIAYSCDYAGDRQKLIIHAWKGAEHISEEPSEEFVIDRGTVTISERKCSAEGPSGLGESFAKELARLTIRVESYFRLPQQVKWIFSGERFYIVGVEKLVVREEKLRTVWGDFGPIELPSYRLTPLSTELLAICLEKASEGLERAEPPFKLGDEKLVSLINGYFYWNVSLIAKIFASVPLVDPWVVPAFRGTPVELGLFSKEAKNSFGLAQNIFAILRFGNWAKKCVKNYEKARELFLKKEDEFIRADLKSKPDASLYLLFEELIENFSLFLTAKMEISFASYALFFMMLTIFNSFVRESREDRNLPQNIMAVFSSLGDTNYKSAFEMLEEMRKLSQLVVACEILDYLKARKTYSDFKGMLRRDEGGDVFLKRLEAFLSAHGHRCVGEEELSRPRWREDAEEVFKWLERIIEEGIREPAENFAEQMNHAGEPEKLSLKMPYFVRRVFTWASRACQQTTRLALESNDLYAKGFMCYRVLGLECGRRFFSRGLLESADDIFYLTYEEIQKLLRMSPIPAEEIKGLVMQRKEEYQHSKDRIPPSFIVGEVYQEEAEEEVSLFEAEEENFEGIGISSGTYTGAVRILSDLKDVITLKRDEIALLRGSGRWALPALLQAGAIVCEDCAFLSELAVTSRAMKIPFISLVRNITKSIAPDKLWVVDADRGVVNLSKEEDNLESDING